jgi:hypothetical protein
MNTEKSAPKSAIGFAAIGLASALAGGLLLATPALAADDSVLGSTSFVLDFRTPGQLGLEVTTQNLSPVSAYGTMSIQIPSGERYDYGPQLYSPGETLTFSVTLPGHPCSDLTLMSAVAYGFTDLSDSTPEWTSGVMRYPDPRATVIGCPTPTPTPTITPTPTPTPTITPTPTPTPTITPTPTPTPTITPTPTPTPTITPIPTPTTTITPAPTGTSTSTAAPSAAGGGGSLAQTGTAVGATLVIAAMGLFAVAAGMFMRGRRARTARSD